MGEISLSIFNLLSILSLFAALIFVFQLYFLGGKSIGKLEFSLYLINISIIISFFLILDLKFEKTALILSPLFLSSVLSIGPLLWLYVNRVLGNSKLKMLKHIIIPIVFGVLLYVLLFLIHFIDDEIVSTIVNQVIVYVTLVGLTLVFLVQNGYYIYQSLKLYKRHLNRVGEVFSYTDNVNLNWLKLLIYGYVVFVLGLIMSNILTDLWSDILFNSILFSYIIYSGYNAFVQESIFKEEVDFEPEITVQKSDFKNDFFKKLKQLLLASMEEDKLYLDDSLTIHSLAKKLNTNSKYLSQLINKDFNKSFVVFVNEYRIEEAKRLLILDEKKLLSIEGVGYESGFKSKSTFNTAFKKFTGETPTSFLKKVK